MKPENFVVVDKNDKNIQFKSIDFGSAMNYNLIGDGQISKMTARVGSALYISPDVLSGSYDQSCDLWSAGCILYTMLCGYAPFSGKDVDEIIKNVQRGRLEFDEYGWGDVSEEAIDLVKSLICKPKRRLSAA